MTDQPDQVTGDLTVGRNLRVDGSSFVFGSGRFEGPLTVTGPDTAARIGIGVEQPQAGLHLGGGADDDLMIGAEGSHHKIRTGVGITTVDTSRNLVFTVDRRPQLQLNDAGITAHVPLTTGRLTARGDVHVTGRLHTRAGRAMSMASNRIATDSTTWRDLMSIRLQTTGNPILALFHTGGVQPSTPYRRARLFYRMTVDGREKTFSMNEFNDNGYELRDVALQWFGHLGAGRHLITIQWRTEDEAYQNNCCWGRATRSLIGVEL